MGDEAYNDGFDDWYDGKYESDNPYNSGTEEHTNWLNGFRRAAYIEGFDPALYESPDQQEEQ